MLKFFRLYNKYILAIGVAVLMVVFLLQPVMQMFTPSPTSRVVGHVFGQKVRQRDLIRAAGEMQILERMIPLLGLTLPRSQDGPQTWMLAVRDAEHMGLSAAPSEVEDILRNVDEQTRRQLSMSMGVDEASMRQALRHWIMVDTYRQLLLGETYRPPLQRLMDLSKVAGTYGPNMVPYLVNRMGIPRLSSPLVRRFVVDQQATVSGKLVMVDATKAVTDLPEPSESELKEMYEQYKDVLPGRGDLPGAGYRIPPRVKIEYLAIPFTQVRDSIEVDEVDALAYFDQHKDEFKDDSGKAQDYTAVRSQVIDKVRDQQAEDKIDQMIRRARALCQEAPQYRQLAEADGYKVIPDGYEPLSLRIVAESIGQEFGIKPQVTYLNQQWTTVDQLGDLSGIGDSSLAERGDVFFVPYVLSCKQMDPPDGNPLVSFRLQTHIISRPLRSKSGSRFLFRLSAAEPAHAPAGLDAVRDHVVADVKHLTAYNLLTAQADQWKQKVASEGLLKVAEGLGETVTDLPVISRAGSERNQAQRLPGVGSSLGFVRAVFDLAGSLEDRQPISDLPESERVLAYPLESKLSLVLFELDAYKPITQAAYEKLARNPQLQGVAGYSLLDDQLTDPLNYDVLVKRTGYTSEYATSETEKGKTSSDETQSDQSASSPEPESGAATPSAGS